MTVSLAKLEDYVFLSDRNTQTNHIVERDGKVWMPGAFPEAYFIKNRQENVIFNWHDFIPGQASWKWRDGYLPILEISDEENLLELSADGENLLVRLNREKAFLPAESRNVSSDRFTELVDQKEKYWCDFFYAGWKPPVNEVFPDAAWRACFVQAINSFCGLHPKYGAGYYNRNYHDGFPPTIISMTDALLDYGQFQMAFDILGYYLDRFVLLDGSIDYYGPSLSEYGMILNLCGKISEVPNGKEWLRDYINVFQNITRYLFRLRNRFVYGDDNKYRLLSGVPEADTRDKGAIYTHNNAWVWRGLTTWSSVANQLGLTEAAEEAKREAYDLKNMLSKAINDMPMADGLVPFRFDQLDAVKTYDRSRDATYANYRYYPELLQTGFLSDKDALKLIQARQQRNGELAGMTHFHFSIAWQGLDTADYCCNNWPIASYGAALAELGMEEDFMHLLNGHFKHHQTHDTFTAYENVDAKVTPIRRAFTDWCVPAQLVFPRLLRWSYLQFGIIEKL